jgi:aspartate/methionine/tyrosine aminotransferase
VRFNPLTRAQSPSPIEEAYAALDQRGKRQEILDLAQAAPPYPPAPEVVDHVVAVAHDPHGADYGEITGLPHLREAFADELTESYRGPVRPSQVLVTAGCNQAFCLAVGALAGPGDEVVVALPYYFNHDMWLRMNGITPVYLDPGPDLVPSAAAAEALVTGRTRALVLVTPGNPSGVTVPPENIAELAEVARRHDAALILDETYRSFRDTAEPAHCLFADPAWSDVLVSLHSFAKDLAIPGYRIGAAVGSEALVAEMAKLADCVAICAPRIGQEAAWAGLKYARRWRDERAHEVAEKRRLFAHAMADRPGGFELVSAGGFFGWVRLPFPQRPTAEVVRNLIVEHDTLVLPGTAFRPDDQGMIRVSVSNLDQPGIADLSARFVAAGIRPGRESSQPGH